MSTALRCTPYAPSRRVPSNRHRKAVAPPATLKLKSTQLSIIVTANVSEETPEGSYHSRAGAIGSLGAPIAFDEVVPGAGVEPACRNYPARDFKSLVSTSFTTRAVTPQNCARRKLEAGVGTNRHHLDVSSAIGPYCLNCQSSLALRQAVLVVELLRPL